MTQGKIGPDKNGKNEAKEVSSRIESNLFFENKIVPVWASTKAAALMLGITPNALRIRKCRGEIECRYFGKHLRFDVNYLASLICNKQKQQGS